jgi:putative restriction endonuclease
VKAYVGITDRDWFDLLSSIASLSEANFWQPGGRRQFRTLLPGELFLFKLHSPDDFIVGGGIFAHATLLPISLAWDAFGFANGARTLDEMRNRVAKYRRTPTDPLEDYTVGCVLLEQPFFLPRDRWIPIPAGWPRNVVQGLTYDLAVEPGASILAALGEMLPRVGPAVAADRRYGDPRIELPRLGQGSFRILVTDVYQRRCSVTRERTLPVLEAAHIKPYAAGGEHRVDNGLLLRSDLHVLFDRGYVTVDPEHRFHVSRRIRAEFENGRDYYALHGRELSLPARVQLRPAREFLEWHNERVFHE